MVIRQKKSQFFRKNRKRKSKGKLFYFIVLISFFWLLSFIIPPVVKFINNSITFISAMMVDLHNVWDSMHGKIILITFFVLTIIAGCLFLSVLIGKNKTKNQSTVKLKIWDTAISDSRHDYIIEENDYRRGNKKEHAYRKYFNLSLLKIFDNSCAKCKRSDNGIEIDHFFLSKNEGGCFILRHKNGHIINNAIPLCISCNRSKSDKHYKIFFTNDELKVVLEKNLRATKAINQFKLLDKIEPKQLLKASIKS